MANTTVRGAQQIHSTNPQFLVEKVIRSRIYDNVYWKEQCFALTAETIIDKAVELKYIGGTTGANHPSPFLCLVLKLLQLQPQKEIILEYLTAEEFKYLRALAAMYVRLTFPAMEVYQVLEPMLNDYRKLRYRHQSGSYTLKHIDEFVDELLTEERVCELILPRITKREVLEETEGLAPRISKLEDVLLNGRSALGDGNASANLAGGERGEDSGAESDDSFQAEKERRRARIERAAQIRAKREAEEQERAARLLGGVPFDHAAMDVDDEQRDGESDYASQEESSEGERYVSRSPSRSISPDRRSGGRQLSDSEDKEPGYRSRSGSRSPDREFSPGYRSRSGSRSPDR